MAQGVLSYQYEEESNDSGMTAWAGLPLFLDLAQAAGLWDSLFRHVGVRAGCATGWSDAQVVMSLVLLNLVGGTAVDDVRILEGDRGFGEVLHRGESAGLTRQQRLALKKKRRREQRAAKKARSFEMAMSQPAINSFGCSRRAWMHCPKESRRSSTVPIRRGTRSTF